jgi:phage shock protein PspC (stress-responsive transcriptional regulator)
MFDSLFDLPLVIVGTAIVVLLCAFALSGLIIFIIFALDRPFSRRSRASA